MEKSRTVNLHLFGPRASTRLSHYPIPSGSGERGIKPLLSGGIINYIHFTEPERSVLWIALIKRLNNTDEYAQKGRFISRLRSL